MKLEDDFLKSQDLRCSHINPALETLKFLIVNSFIISRSIDPMDNCSAGRATYIVLGSVVK